MEKLKKWWDDLQVESKQMALKKCQALLGPNRSLEELSDEEEDFLILCFANEASVPLMEAIKHLMERCEWAERGYYSHSRNEECRAEYSGMWEAYRDALSNMRSIFK